MEEAQPVCVFNPVVSHGPHPSPLHSPVPLRLTFPRGHFPRLAECAHFHYETVDFGNVQVSPENLHTQTHTHMCSRFLCSSAGALGLPFLHCLHVISPEGSIKCLPPHLVTAAFISPFHAKACCSSWLILRITAYWCQRQLA